METKELNKEEKKNAAVQVTVQEKTICDNVLSKIEQFTRSGSLQLPKDYSAPNALKVAWLILMETTTTDGKPVLENCTQPSIANSLLRMCIMGLNPIKKQGYFIAYGNKLRWQESYQGNTCLAKRFSNLIAVHPQIIYKGDDFKYEISPDTGIRRVIKHDQNLENIDNNNIVGGYCIGVFEDGKTEMEIMTILEIRTAWKQGFGGGNTKAHQNFTQEMCKKTVINRFCKSIINSSDDSSLFNDDDNDDEQNQLDARVKQEIKSNANKGEHIGFEEIKVSNDIKTNANVPTVGFEDNQEKKESAENTNANGQQSEKETSTASTAQPGF